jgi:hypothetical protein
MRSESRLGRRSKRPHAAIRLPPTGRDRAALEQHSRCARTCASASVVPRHRRQSAGAIGRVPAADDQCPAGVVAGVTPLIELDGKSGVVRPRKCALRSEKPKRRSSRLLSGEPVNGTDVVDEREVRADRELEISRGVLPAGSGKTSFPRTCRLVLGRPNERNLTDAVVGAGQGIRRSGSDSPDCDENGRKQPSHVGHELCHVRALRQSEANARDCAEGFPRTGEPTP